MSSLCQIIALQRFMILRSTTQVMMLDAGMLRERMCEMRGHILGMIAERESGIRNLEDVRKG
jgi:hypothetical protein